MNGIRFCRMSSRLSVLGVLGVGVLFAGCGQPPQVATVNKQQQTAADDLGVPVEITNSIGMKLKLIPVGEFMMGSPEEEQQMVLENLKATESPQWAIDHLSTEGPQHLVRITKPFYLGVYEVTQAEYENVMGENPSKFKGATNPVEQVTWDEAMEFCKRLSATEGKTYRLPTEAEWEYACRAGSTTPYSFGDDEASLGEYAWYNVRDWKTYPVGEKKANAWGLHDMHGNVSEWCQDRYDHGYYRDSPTDDPPGPERGNMRVFRGGHWADVASDCRAAYRFSHPQPGGGEILGFRVVAVEEVEAAAESKSGEPSSDDSPTESGTP